MLDWKVDMVRGDFIEALLAAGIGEITFAYYRYPEKVSSVSAIFFDGEWKGEGFLLTLSGDGESIELSRTSMDEYLHISNSRLCESYDIHGLCLNMLLHKSLQKISIFSQEGKMIGIELATVEGSWHQIFNNGDQFTFSTNEDLPPSQEAGVVREDYGALA